MFFQAPQLIFEGGACLETSNMSLDILRCKNRGMPFVWEPERVPFSGYVNMGISLSPYSVVFSDGELEDHSSNVISWPSTKNR